MNKIAASFLICCCVVLQSMFAQEPAEEDVLGGYFISAENNASYENGGFPEEEKPNVSRTKDRSWEVGLANLDLGFSNNILRINEILKETIVLNIDDFKQSLKLNFSLGLYPIFFNYNKDDTWGIGIRVGVDAYGAVDIAGEILSLQQADNVTSDAAGAAFIEIGLPAFFRLPVFDKLKIKIKPSVYYPLAYLRNPDILYTYQVEGSQNYVDINVSGRVYTAFSLEENASFELTAAPGFDLSIGAEFPLSQELGLDDIPILDFDVGVDFSGIPLIPASMTNYMEANVRVNGENPIIIDENIIDENQLDNFLTADAPAHGKNKIFVLRPFKMLVWADWRPFQSVKSISFIPTVGFSVNPIYDEPGAFEGGIKARWDFRNMLILSAGTGYYDRLFKNSFDLALNLRAFELNIGASLQASEFVKSWEGNGLGLVFGLKFGW